MKNMITYAVNVAFNEETSDLIQHRKYFQILGEYHANNRGHKDGTSTLFVHLPKSELAGLAKLLKKADINVISTEEIEPSSAIKTRE